MSKQKLSIQVAKEFLGKRFTNPKRASKLVMDILDLEISMMTMRDDLDIAWGIIANVSNGDWDTQTAEWRQSAELWRDRVVISLAATQQEKEDGE